MRSMSTVASRPARPSRLSRRRRVLFGVVATLGVLLVAEIAIRIGRAPTHFGSFRELRLDMMKRNYPAERDPRLGYAPRPGFASHDNHWGTQVSIDDAGLRRNGEGPPPPGERCVVAVGDSFTFGDQVDDAESWPAHLEVALQMPVKNGGVFGYSLAQAVLRAELLMEAFPVETLVVSFVPDDLTRCEYSRRYVPLPWFDLVGQGLVLQPVPAGGDDVDDGGRALKDALGHSALLDAVLANTFRAWWYENDKQRVVPHLVGKGGEIGTRLVDRIAEVCRSRGVRLLVVQQGDAVDPAGREVIRHAQARGVEALDLVSMFLAAEAEAPGLHAKYFKGHMTSAGNAWVAAQIAAVLRVPTKGR